MGIESILLWIVIGAIAGVLARFLMPGNDPMGMIGTILLGIVGAFIGGFLFDALDIGGGDTLWTIVSATVGALIALFIYRAATGRRAGARL